MLRELTKKHETVFRTTLSAAAEFYQQQAPRGECVLVLEGADAGAQKALEQSRWNEMPLAGHLEYYLAQGMSQKDAMKAAAADRGVSKRDIYAQWLAQKDSE